MKARTMGIGLATALALAFPTAAAAGGANSVVPPENSAATQYTEALPTAGGDKEAGGGSKKPSPAKVLGTHNANQLKSHGKEGQEVAEVVAETAPETTVAPEPTPATEPEHSSGGGTPNETKPPPSSHPQHTANLHQGVGPNEPVAFSRELPSGSSGLGEVLAEATGSSSSGELGMLLPLAIVAALIWSLVYFWRQRRPAA